MDSLEATDQDETGNLLSLPDDLLNLIADFLPMADFGRLCQSCSRVSSNAKYIENRLNRIPWSLVSIRSHVDAGCTITNEFELYLGVRTQVIIYPNPTSGSVYIDRIEGWGGHSVKEGLRHYPDVMVKFAMGDSGIPRIEGFSKGFGLGSRNRTEPIRVFLGDLDGSPGESDIYDASWNFSRRQGGWFDQKEIVVDPLGEKRGTKRPLQVVDSDKRPPKRSRLVLVDTFWIDAEGLTFDSSEESEDDYDY